MATTFLHYYKAFVSSNQDKLLLASKNWVKYGYHKSWDLAIFQLRLFGGILLNSYLMLLLCVISGSGVAADKDPFTSVKEYSLKGNIHKASEELLKIEDRKLTPRDQAYKYFSLGVWYQEMESWSEARNFLLKGLELDDDLLIHTNYQLAKIYKAQRNWKEALDYYNKVYKVRAPRNIQLDTRFDISQILMEKRQWKEAYPHLIYLERNWRGEEHHPEVLWRLIRVELKRHRKWKACRWARRLYSKYPAHPIIYDWGIDLQEAPMDGEKLGCLASEYDMIRRLQRLQWAGETARAKRELEILASRAGENQYEIDRMQSEFLIYEGLPDQALKVLLTHFDKQKSNYDYLMLLAKASSKAGEFQTAVGAYYRAHKLRPQSRHGRQALFHAAFLSYQFQDYDGATRKFQQFVEMYKRSGLQRDALWHLAWLHYLKGDYQGAVIGLNDILKQKKRHGRRWRKFSTEKIKYWLAMSYLRLKQYDRARQIFTTLATNKLMDFYSQTARFRLEDLPADTDGLLLANIDRTPTSVESFEKDSEAKTDFNSEEGESEETLAESEPEEDMDLVTEDGGEAIVSEEVQPIDFKDPKLQANFDRAQNFIRLGFYDRARWEYYEIERRTSHREYLKLLIQSYEKIESFHRSAYIGEIYFSTPRKRYGLSGARPLWEATYPRAFYSSVEKYGKEFNVPNEFIWAIMRAESRFRPMAVSPVGAQGLMQIMPNTGRQVAKLLGEYSFHSRSLREPEVNIRIGSRYLQRLLKKFDYTLPLAAAGYNAGPHRVESWLASFGNLDMDEFIEHIPFLETRNYVKKVIHYYGVYGSLYAPKFKPMSWLSQPVPVRIARKPAHRETWE